MSSPVKPLILVISGAGFTGKAILDALAQAGKWRLAATVRPASVNKPEVQQLRALDVEIRPCDWQNDGPVKLDEAFYGAEVVISCAHGAVVLDQTVLVDAAKRAKVQRFVPADFGPACIPGVRDMYDQKLKIREYVKKVGVPYTFIDIGFWMQITLPYRSSVPGPLAKRLREFHGTGQKQTAVINRDHIGNFVGAIVADPRTLNQYVFAFEDEVTLQEVYDMASKLTGENTKASSTLVDEDEVSKLITLAKARYAHSGEYLDIQEWYWYEYMRSIYYYGHNNAAQAQSQGALIGKELYPEIKCQSVAEYADTFYASVNSVTESKAHVE